MIQTQFLNRLLSTKNASLLTINNLNHEFFSDYVNEYKFIQAHLDQYGIIPDIETFVSKFPDFDVINVTESDKYLLDALYEDRNKRIIAKAYNQVREDLQKGDVDKALSACVKLSDNLSQAKHLEAVDIFKDLSRYDDYVDRTTNFSKYYISTGFPELDEIIGGWDRKEELATIAARTNQGKCLAKGTKVLMADGTFKNVEDIVVGDKVQSLDRVNTVLGLHNGISGGYKIIPKNGDPFIVSDNHILTLMKRNDDFYNKNRKSPINKFDLIDIQIEDFLKLAPKYRFHNYMLYRPSIDYEEKNLLIPPYILGLWLGDGSSCRVELTSMDQEIIDEWYKYAQSLDMKVSIYESKSQPNRAKAYEITKGKAYSGNRYNYSTALRNFRNYNLINNKHIPLDYLTSSKIQRLELLAGIIDTDGHLQGGDLYEITLKSKILIDNISQLARGLGFKTSIKPHPVTLENGESRVYWTINISGALDEIPVKLSRKKYIKNKVRSTNPQMTSFTIERVERVEYYGFMADGDHRYLLSDNTLTHNTWLLLKTAIAAAEQGLKVGIYSGEMSVNKVGYRIDTLMSHISNSKISKGDVGVQPQYKKFLEDAQRSLRGNIVVLTPEILGDLAGVGDLRAFIEKEKLDILCIDQHSLLKDDNNAKNLIEKAANISRDLKKLQVLKKIPIIALSQQNREKNETGTPGTENIAQSDRIAQDSTCIIFFDQKEDKSLDNYNKLLTMYLVKSRDSANGMQIKYSVNFNTGTFIYIPSEEDALKGNTCDDLKDEYEYSDDEDSYGDQFN